MTFNVLGYCKEKTGNKIYGNIERRLSKLYVGVSCRLYSGDHKYLEINEDHSGLEANAERTSMAGS